MKTELDGLYAAGDIRQDSAAPSDRFGRRRRHRGYCGISLHQGDFSLVCCLTTSIKKLRLHIRHSRENGNPGPSSTWIPFFNGMTDNVRHLISACARMTLRATMFFLVLNFAARSRGRIG